MCISLPATDLHPLVPELVDVRKVFVAAHVLLKGLLGRVAHVALGHGTGKALWEGEKENIKILEVAGNTKSAAAAPTHLDRGHGAVLVMLGALRVRAEAGAAAAGVDAVGVDTVHLQQMLGPLLQTGKAALTVGSAAFEPHLPMLQLRGGRRGRRGGGGGGG